MAGKRARAQKKRADYRKGGRVNLEIGGGIPFDDPEYVRGGTATTGGAGYGQGASTGSTQKRVVPTYTAEDVNQAYADLNAGKTTTSQLASMYGVDKKYVEKNLADYNAKIASDKAAADKAVADKAAAEKAAADAAAAAAKAPVLDIPADGDYTEAETQVVQDAIASGAISAAEVAAKFGVTEDQVTTEIKRREAVAKGETLPENMVFLPETPIEDRLTDAQKELFDPYATKSPTMDDSPTAQAALQKADEAYQAGDMTYEEWAQVRENFKIEYPYEFRDMDAEAAAQAAADAKAAEEAAAQAKTTAAVTDIPVDADYTQFEIDQVYDALQSGAMTVEQVAEQFGATVAQVQAEFNRMKQAKAGETVTGEDPFEEGVYEATKKALADKKAKEKKTAQEAATTKRKEDLDTDTAKQLDNIDVETRTWVADDPTTDVDESLAPGAFLKDYERVDPDLLFDKREAEGLSVQEGITKDSQIKQLAAYEDITAPTDVDEQDFDVALGTLKKAADAGEVDPGDYAAYLVNELNNNPQWATSGRSRKVSVDEIRALTERTTAAKFGDVSTQSMAKRITDDFISDASSVDKVDFRKSINVSPTKEAEAQTREAITGTKATEDAARITKEIGYEAFQRKEVRGTAAKDAAITFTAKTAEIEPNLARTLVEDPASVTAQIDSQEPEVKIAIAAVPPEALVSAQMETLMAGIETGEVPVWARPAFDLVNQAMTQRGLDASTVGRDALFNAIIQSALPIAQSNAQALQANAAAKLDREQQAYLQEAQINANRRLNNLANEQTSESQTAQFSQNLNVLQSQFNQERDTLSFNQQQQFKLTNLQNKQRTVELNTQAENALKAQSLGNEQQIELAELEIKNQTEQQNMTAINQERLAEMQVAADFASKNEGFVQQMNLANLNADQQMRLANLSARNQADAESLSNEQQVELANLNARMQTNLAQGRIAENMGVALLNADQQRAVENATMNARMDLTKFNDAQQVELANSKFMQTVDLTDFNARQQAIMQDATALATLDVTAVDQRTKLEITRAQNFLSRDMANLSNEQQALILDTQVEQQRLLSNQASQNASRQFNATSENQINQFNESLAAQIEQFNAQQGNAMEQFNAAEENRVEAINAANAIDAAKFNNQIDMQVKTFNEQMDLQREQWNAANAQAVEQSNIEWRRKANTIDTAAKNAVNQENAAKSFQISSGDQSFIWNELRDEAAYLRQAYESDQQRKTTLYATAISNDIESGALGIQPIVDIVDGVLAK